MLNPIFLIKVMKAFIKSVKNSLRSQRVKKIEFDPFIERLGSTLIGRDMLHEGNIFLFNHGLKNIPDKGFILEIGSYAGMSANLINHLLTKHQKSRKIFSCDPWIYEGFLDKNQGSSQFIDGRSDIERTSYNAYIKQAYMEACYLLSKHNLPYAFQYYSDDFFQFWKSTLEKKDLFDRTCQLGGSLAFTYIDGDHSYEQAKKDFDNTFELTVSGGFILLDDSGKGMPFGSAKLALELKGRNDIEVVFANPNYLLRKR